ncbi:hypothetical protein NE237_023341 [Protea cynaroides]|uniref:Uncharacterized protein n=1 Tax=Protea cynaroides TaxID=273540 RepID=A0A9Q0HG35_9MAGN|nr:hypothetical protein NE237_023341 [Protea cynaroides]
MVVIKRKVSVQVGISIFSKQWAIAGAVSGSEIGAPSVQKALFSSSEMNGFLRFWKGRSLLRVHTHTLFHSLFSRKNVKLKVLLVRRKNSSLPLVFILFTVLTTKQGPSRKPSWSLKLNWATAIYSCLQLADASYSCLLLQKTFSH